MDFAMHHIAISVRSTSESQDFYELFGFAFFSEISNEEVRITHLKNKQDMIIELFEYFDNKRLPALELVSANNPSELGVKHIGFRVDGLEYAYEKFAAKFETTEPKVARTKGIKYFFVKDPDGNWVEILTDDRLNGATDA